MGEVTAEQREIVDRLLTAKDYYAILGVPKTATDADIKSAFRKLMMKVHPDKNKAPRAGEAFDQLKRANECLTDPSKRAIYDEKGIDMNHPPVHDFRAEINPEELFKTFFGENYSGEAVPPRAFSKWEDYVVTLLKMVPLIMIIIAALFYSHESAFVYVKTEAYPLPQHTLSHEAPYFVAEGFDAAYPIGSTQRDAMEKRIERHYVDHLSERCWLEERTKHTLSVKAKTLLGKERLEMEEKAHKMATPSCRRAADFERALAVAAAVAA